MLSGATCSVASKNLLRFNKINSMVCSRPGVMPGDRCVFIDDDYSEHVCIVKKVDREMASKKKYCKLFAVDVYVHGSIKSVLCVYFGSVARVCILKDKKYDKFDELV